MYVNNVVKYLIYHSYYSSLYIFRHLKHNILYIQIAHFIIILLFQWFNQKLIFNEMLFLIL